MHVAWIPGDDMRNQKLGKVLDRNKLAKIGQVNMSIPYLGDTKK